MALLITKENRPVFVTAEQAKLLWLVKTGERKGTPTTREKAKQIAKWYLCRSNAPKSWLDTHPPIDSKPKRQVLQPALPYKD